MSGPCSISFARCHTLGGVRVGAGLPLASRMERRRQFAGEGEEDEEGGTGALDMEVSEEEEGEQVDEQELGMRLGVEIDDGDSWEEGPGAEAADVLPRGPVEAATTDLAAAVADSDDELDFELSESRVLEGGDETAEPDGTARFEGGLAVRVRDVRRVVQPTPAAQGGPKLEEWERFPSAPAPRAPAPASAASAQGHRGKLSVAAEVELERFLADLREHQREQQPPPGAPSSLAASRSGAAAAARAAGGSAPAAESDSLSLAASVRRNELPAADSTRVGVELGVEWLQHDELEGSSAFVRRELPVTVLFQPSPSPQPPLLPQQQAKEAGQPALAELAFSHAKVSALERKVQELTAALEAQNTAGVTPEASSQPHLANGGAAPLHHHHVLSAEDLRRELRASEAPRLDAVRELREMTHKLEASAAELAQLREESRLRANAERTVEALRADLEDERARSRKLEAQVMQLGWASTNATAGGALSPRRLKQQQQQQSPAPQPQQPQQQQRPAPVIDEAPASPFAPVAAVVPELSFAPGKPARAAPQASPERPANLQPGVVEDEMDAMADPEGLAAEEQLLYQRLALERERLSGAKERIRAARALSSQSLEFAVGELRALEAARAKAEARAAALEQQVQRTQRDMVVLSRNAARRDEGEDAESVAQQPTLEPVYHEQMPGSDPEEMWQRAQQQQQQQQQQHVQHVQHLQQLDEGLAVGRDTPVPSHIEHYAHAEQHQQQPVHAWPASSSVSSADRSEAAMSKRERAAVLREQILAAAERERAEQQDPEWAKSRESLAPFATDASARDLLKGFSLLERKLMIVNMERDKCEAAYARLVNRGGVRSKKALDEKIYLEARIAELHKEASNVRIALRRQPS